MILGLCGSLAGAGVVAARSTRDAAVVDRQEHERPAAHEIACRDDEGPSQYLEGMERWTESMFELIDHAATSPAAIETGACAELRSAGDDTSDLRDLLHANRHLPLKVSGMATLRSICSMWEAEQARIEPLAARMDQEWYRRWRARSVVERILRHGRPPTTMPALPYRA